MNCCRKIATIYLTLAARRTALASSLSLIAGTFCSLSLLVHGSINIGVSSICSLRASDRIPCTGALFGRSLCPLFAGSLIVFVSFELTGFGSLLWLIAIVESAIEITGVDDCGELCMESLPLGESSATSRCLMWAASSATCVPFTGSALVDGLLLKSKLLPNFVLMVFAESHGLGDSVSLPVLLGECCNELALCALKDDGLSLRPRGTYTCRSGLLGLSREYNKLTVNHRVQLGESNRLTFAHLQRDPIDLLHLHTLDSANKSRGTLGQKTILFRFMEGKTSKKSKHSK